MTHVLFFDAGWTKGAARTLRARADGWRQSLTLRLPPAVDELIVEHSASEIPGAAFRLLEEPGGATRLTVTTRHLERLDAGRLYRTQVLVRSDENLNGTAWEYREEISGGGGEHFRAAAASAHKRGTTGWCSTCYLAWGTAEGF